MSFLDLATLALHRRNELDTRISSFVIKCDTAIKNITKLKCQAKTFVQELNCEQSSLKERFLNCMKQLDEFTYIITEFNLSIETCNESYSSDSAPVLDTDVCSTTLKATERNLMDILSEPVPSTSSACPNQCPPKVRKSYKVPKNQVLIEFSSNSCSSESVTRDKIETVKIKDEEPRTFEQCYLPRQWVFQTDTKYSAAILHVDGGALWMLTENFDQLHSLMSEMTEYYKNPQNVNKLTVREASSLTYCAYYDDETDSFYRTLNLGITQNNTVNMFLVDTGEPRESSVETLQPLVSQFCTEPPLARCCYLAGVELLSIDDCSEDLVVKQEEFLSQYIGVMFDIEIKDNTSEFLGIYVWLDSKRTLNDLLVTEGLAKQVVDEPAAQANVSVMASQAKTSVMSVHAKTSATSSQTKTSLTSSQKTSATSSQTKTSVALRSPEMLEEINITDCPEHEDAVVAVTGYHNRDEADICKHYTGGPDKTCFKGALCKKKHIKINPEGWTLDRVEVRVRCPQPPLPAPGAWRDVSVSCVSHIDHVYVQYVEEKQEEPVRQFGVIPVPRSLESLIRDMNSNAARMAYKPMTLKPALGELVAALYPLDDMWYRAQVLCFSRTEQSIKVQYIDYGTVSWVKEDQVRALNERHAKLGARAQLARLAGVRARGDCSRQWAQAKAHLEELTRNRVLHMFVVARNYDVITVELYDNGYNVAEQMAAANMVELEPYCVEDDTKVTKKVVVP